jgi:hypothetical protein
MRKLLVGTWKIDETDDDRAAVVFGRLVGHLKTGQSTRYVSLMQGCRLKKELIMCPCHTRGHGLAHLGRIGHGGGSSRALHMMLGLQRQGRIYN